MSLLLLFGNATAVVTIMDVTTAGAITVAGQSTLFQVRLNPAEASVSIAGQTVILRPMLLVSPGAVSTVGQSTLFQVQLAPANAGVTAAGQSPLVQITFAG